MKIVTVKYIHVNGDLADGVLLESLEDVALLKGPLKSAEMSVLRKFVKSGESPGRFDHIISGFEPLEQAISRLSIFDSKFQGISDNPLYLLGNSSDQYLKQLTEVIIKYGSVFINKTGGMCPPLDGFMQPYLEIVQSEDIDVYPKKMWRNYKIEKKTKYIVLENDCELERKAVDYLEKVNGYNYSYIKDMMLLDDGDMTKIFGDFVAAGGEVVYVYTTGQNNEQMYSYSKCAIQSGIMKFEFYFNSGMDDKIRAFISWLSGKDGVSVKVLNIQTVE